MGNSELQLDRKSKSSNGDFEKKSRTAFLFDLDGTLVDSVYQHVLAWREALEHLGIDLSAWRIHRRIGMSGGLLVKGLLLEAARALFFSLLMPLFLVSVSNAQDNDAPRQSSTDENPPSRVARLSFTKGNVSFLRAGLDQWSQATQNFPVTTGDRIYTDKKARAELEIGLYAVRLSETTDLTVTNLNDQITQ